MCEAIDSKSSGNETFTKLYAAANIFYNYSGSVTCFDISNDSGGWDWQVSSTN